MEAGQIDILNTGHGHLELRFNPEDPLEINKATIAINDMIKRGFILFIHGEDQKLIRAERFDATKSVYIISDVPGSELLEGVSEPVKGKREVPAAKARVTAIGRSAGG